MRVRDKLARLLEKKGYKLAKESNSSKIVKKFEKEELSKKLFNIMKSEQFFRVIGYYLFKKSIMNVDDLVREISKTNLKYTMNESIVKRAVCKHCKNEMRFAKFDPIPNIRCQECGRKDFVIEDDWKLKLDIYRILIHYLIKLKNEKIISKDLELYCPLCLTGSEYLEENKLKRTRNFANKLICEKCGNIKEIKWIFTPPETISNLWESDGLWLEWYVKNLLLSKGVDVIQGVKIKSKNKEELEVDLLLLSPDDKIISIECRTKSFNNTYNEVPDISKLFPFSDYIIFITTTKISDSLKSRYKKISPRCKKIFVDGNEIENLPKIIKQLGKRSWRR